MPTCKICGKPTTKRYRTIRPWGRTKAVLRDYCFNCRNFVGVIP